MKRLYLFLLFVAVSIALPAQNLPYYKKVVKELSSAKYQGRGYAKNGVRKAGNYIDRQFRKVGVNMIIPQSYSIDINTFPGDMRVALDGQKLVPGDEFVMREYSPGVHGTFPLYFIDTLNYDPKRVLEDLKKPENKGAFVVCDFWFPYRHREGFAEMQSDTNCPNAGMLFTWDTPLKFYKAYGEKVSEKPIIWAAANAVKPSAHTISASVDNEFLENYQSDNIIACVQGERHDSCFVVTAHYDHLGNMGRKLYFPGVNDNASGTAALITLAQYYVQHKPKFDIYFIAFSGEEANLRGSTYFVEHPKIPLDRICYLFNLDMIGDNNPIQYCEVSESGMGGFAKMEQLNSQNHYFKALNRGELDGNSDHWPFAEKGVPCILFENESGDNFPFYHTKHDDWHHAYFDTYEAIFKLIRDYIEL